jgi:hypothetical protein
MGRDGAYPQNVGPNAFVTDANLQRDRLPLSSVVTAGFVRDAAPSSA